MYNLLSLQDLERKVLCQVSFAVAKYSEHRIPGLRGRPWLLNVSHTKMKTLIQTAEGRPRTAFQGIDNPEANYSFPAGRF